MNDAIACQSCPLPLWHQGTSLHPHTAANCYGAPVFAWIRCMAGLFLLPRTTVALAELVHTTATADHTLLTGEKRMALA